MTMNDKTQSAVRSYVLRQGRLTKGQDRVLSDKWQEYGLDISEDVLDFQKIFGRNAPVVLEIGYGNGESLAQMAENNPEQDYIGIEVHRPGVGHLFLQLEEKALSNVRSFEGDAVTIINQCIPNDSLSRVQIFFPDPWHKKRHNKRRLVQASFISHLITKVKNEGVIHLATDWEPYAEQMLEVMSAETRLVNMADGFHPRPDYRPLTKFERRGERKGHGVWDLLFKKSC